MSNDLKKISPSGAQKVKSSGTLLSTAISAVPPSLRRFWDFTRDMAQQFSRHLAKDRTNELADKVKEEF